jgi:Ribonuclease HI
VNWRHNAVQLVWVPGHEGILGNGRDDELAKKGADTPFIGPEPVLVLPYSVVKRAIGDWMERKHIYRWKSGKDCKHSKALVEGPQQSRATKLLNMSRQQLSVVIGLLTGHLDLNGHLYKIGKDIKPLFRRCLSGNEIVEHLPCESESLTISRNHILGQIFLELQQLSHVPVDIF